LTRYDSQVTRTVQDADDSNRVVIWPVINGVSAVKSDAQASPKLWAFWMRQREGQQLFAGGSQFAKKPVCDSFR